ncbi:hypothetical protein [Eisenibacter elegans]|jgi:hypothetical protein|uniref:hypothetical protein n=1 Tax=Eisenibacter elegans TaxID=997 RepID=UPI000422EAF3|nr:hypothetical protein [Eisenibacter elegans]
MQTTILALLLGFLTLGTGLAQGFKKDTKVKITPYISVTLPAGFAPMPDMLIVRKYGAYRPPLAMYTSMDEVADFGVNKLVNRSLKAQTDADFYEQDLQILAGFYKSTILALHSNVVFLQEGIREVNGKRVIIYEFVGEVKDEEKSLMMGKPQMVRQYSHLRYAVINNEVHIFNFNCPAQVRDKWQPIGQRIMDSLELQ